MTIDFQRWPADFAARYRARGYWLDQPLTRILDTQRQERPDAIAIICGDRQISYAELDRKASNLAFRLSEAGLGQGDTALVQLPNCAEFYIVFFALLKIGVAPVNALFSHRKLEMSSYAQQIEPRLVIGARSHELFADDDFPTELRTLSPRLSLVLLLGGNRAYNDLERWLASETSAAPAGSPSPADVAMICR